MEWNVLGGGVVLDQLAILHLVSLADPVDLLVDLRAVMVSLLTGPGHRKGKRINKDPNLGDETYAGSYFLCGCESEWQQNECRFLLLMRMRIWVSNRMQVPTYHEDPNLEDETNAGFYLSCWYESRVADPDPDLFGRIRSRKISPDPYPDPNGTMQCS